MSDLDDYRSEIEVIDEEILKLLGRRLETSRKIALYKLKAGMSAFQPEQHSIVVKKRQQAAAKYKLDSAFVNVAWRLFMAESIRIQEEVLDGKNR